MNFNEKIKHPVNDSIHVFSNQTISTLKTMNNEKMNKINRT